MKITIDIYSGRPNPSWLLVGDNLESLRVEITRAINAAAPKTGPVRLGFRGVILEATGEEEDLRLGFRGRKVILVDPRGPIEESEVALAKTLLGTAGSALTGEMAEVIADQIDRFFRGNSNKPGVTPTKPGGQPEVPDACDRVLLPYHPDWWNDDPVRVENNNCYNYGTNCANNTFAQPGLRSGQEYNQCTCDNVGAAAVRDGLERQCEAREYSVALVMTEPGAEIEDYHWYRQQEGSIWGHKPGHWPVTDLDDAGRVIIDPQTANRGIYEIFCGYMWSPVGLVVS